MHFNLPWRNSDSIYSKIQRLLILANMNLQYEEKTNLFGFFVINAAQLIFSTIATFLIKQTVIDFPFPYFMPFLRISMGLILLLLYNWALHEFSLDTKWILPPKPLIGWLFFASFVYSILCILLNIGFFVSSIDFLSIFRMTGVFFNAILGVSFLGEKLSIWGILSLLIIFIGMVISLSDFHWSITKLSPNSQIILMIVTIFVESINSFIYKKCIEILSTIKTSFNILSFTSWEYFISLFPLLIASRLRDSLTSADLELIFQPKPMANFFLIAFLGNLGTLLTLHLHRITNFIALGIINQLKLVITLIASHFVFGETIWDFKRSFGVFLLCIAGILFAFLESMRAKNPAKKELPDEVILLNGAGETI